LRRKGESDEFGEEMVERDEKKWEYFERKWSENGKK